MLKRKIEKQLLEWKQREDKKPLIIKGCRQCGKTSSVLQFAKKHYKQVAYINFFENPMYGDAFLETLEVDHIVMMLSALLGQETDFVPGETVLIFDEIQECAQARTSLKFFALDGRYDVIATGSLLGVGGYGEVPQSVPVGYETVLTMCPMDFEEFLWASKIPEPSIRMVREYFEKEIPMPVALHNQLRQLLLQYVVVGGMPDVVQTFVDTKQMDKVLAKQRDILFSYRDDMVKYAPKEDKSCIRECFDSIPKQLAKENKKFQYSTIKKGGKAAKYLGSLQWIEDAGIITRCYNLELPQLPLDGHAIADCFKVYMCDSGLFVAMLEDGTQFDILNGNLTGYKGAIFENLMADIFYKMGRKLYYYHKDSGLEIDFVMRYQGACTLLEVKATTGNVKSAKTILKHPEKYDVHKVIKLGDYNVGHGESMVVLPLYMAFLLESV